MTAKYVSIRQKIGEKCISVNAPIILVPTGQKMCFCLLPRPPDCPLCSPGTAEGWYDRLGGPWVTLALQGPGRRCGEEKPVP